MCTKLKKLQNRSLRLFRFSNSAHDLEINKQAQKQFKNTCGNEKRPVQNIKRTTQVKNRNKPKPFWQLTKENNYPTNTTNYISSDKWVEYFSNFLYDEKHRSLIHNKLSHTEILNDGVNTILNRPITDAGILKNHT